MILRLFAAFMGAYLGAGSEHRGNIRVLLLRGVGSVSLSVLLTTVVWPVTSKCMHDMQTCMGIKHTCGGEGSVLWGALGGILHPSPSAMGGLFRIQGGGQLKGGVGLIIFSHQSLVA